jgi:hypothetical protein
MPSTATQATSSTAAVLTGLRETAAEITRAEVEKLHLTIEWAELNQVEPDDEYASYAVSSGGIFGDRGIPVAGEGAPLVCSTPTSPKPRSKAPTRWVGVGTPGPRSAWSRSANGAATRTPT